MNFEAYKESMKNMSDEKLLSWDFEDYLKVFLLLTNLQLPVTVAAHRK